MKSSKDLRVKIISAGRKAVEHLIEVAEEKIVQKHVDSEGEVSELAADRLKNAAATKKIAIFDAFDILARIDTEEQLLKTEENGQNEVDSTKGFAERRSK